MTTPSTEEKRILAIDPTTKGFGFAVLEAPNALIDWGVRHPIGHPSDLNNRCLKQAAQLIARYQPDILVVEDAVAKGSRRCPRVCQLIEDLVALASDRHVQARCIPRQRVLRHFSVEGATTKRQVAVALAERFPELEPHLPPARKCYMSEDGRMSIFDAIAFAWTFFEPLRKERRVLALLDVPAQLPNA